MPEVLCNRRVIYETGEIKMSLTINKAIRENDKLRESFMELAVETFDLSFKAWYEAGYWTDKYIPYAMVDGEKVVANASVNIIDTVWKGVRKHYIQIGTVMTDKAYRKRGLSRRLLEEILCDWKDRCDAVYLFANDTVLDFYPRFGFVEAREYQCSVPTKGMPVSAGSGTVRKLDMSAEADKALLKHYYAKSNPFSELPMVDNYGLLMFYCSAFMKDSVFYCEEYDAVVIASQEGEAFTCYDIYCDKREPLQEIVAASAGAGTEKVVFGFTPKDTSGCLEAMIDNQDDTLFVLNGKENIFAENRVMLPVLSHA